MYVKIDTDILESILKAFARRQRHQTRIYGVLLGTLDGKDSYHIKNTLINFIYEEPKEEMTSTTKVNKY
jgi:proteasome lid subunit RPN8/RPN11